MCIEYSNRLMDDGYFWMHECPMLWTTDAFSNADSDLKVYHVNNLLCGLYYRNDDLWHSTGQGLEQPLCTHVTKVEDIFDVLNLAEICQ